MRLWLYEFGGSYGVARAEDEEEVLKLASLQAECFRDRVVILPLDHDGEPTLIAEDASEALDRVDPGRPIALATRTWPA